MLTTSIVTALVIAFVLLAAVGHLLLFTAVVFKRGTVLAEQGEKGRAPAEASARVSLT